MISPIVLEIGSSALLNDRAHYGESHLGWVYLRPMGLLLICFCDVCLEKMLLLHYQLNPIALGAVLGVMSDKGCSCVAGKYQAVFLPRSYWLKQYSIIFVSGLTRSHLTVI